MLTRAERTGEANEMLKQVQHDKVTIKHNICQPEHNVCQPEHNVCQPELVSGSTNSK